MPLPAALANFGSPLSRPSMKVNSFEAAGVIAAALSIRVVLRTSCESQIRDLIVSAVAVDVVEVAVRPFPEHEDPRQAMAFVYPAIYLDTQIAADV